MSSCRHQLDTHPSVHPIIWMIRCPWIPRHFSCLENRLSLLIFSQFPHKLIASSTYLCNEYIYVMFATWFSIIACFCIILLLHICLQVQRSTACILQLLWFSWLSLPPPRLTAIWWPSLPREKKPTKLQKSRKNRKSGQRRARPINADVCRC